MTKSEIRALIADGQLRPALALALAYAEKCRLPEPLNSLTTLSGVLETQHQQWRTGQLSIDEFSRVQARGSAALLEIVEELPDTPAPVAQVRLLDEQQYKWRIFKLMLALKVIVLLRLAYHWMHGGFSQAEFFSTLTLLGAALAAHTMVMFDDLLRPAHPHKRRYVAASVAWLVQGLLLLYGLALFGAVEYKAVHNDKFAEMNTWITLTETLLGGYVGKVVGRFFKGV